MILLVTNLIINVISPGHSFPTPGHSTNVPGHSTNVPGHSTNVPGHSLVGPLFCSHDNTVPGEVYWSSPRTGPKLIHLTLSSMRCHLKSSNSDWTRFQVLAVWSSPRLDQIAWTWSLVQSSKSDLKYDLKCLVRQRDGNNLILWWLVVSTPFRF